MLSVSWRRLESRRRWQTTQQTTPLSLIELRFDLAHLFIVIHVEHRRLSISVHVAVASLQLVELCDIGRGHLAVIGAGPFFFLRLRVIRLLCRKLFAPKIVMRIVVASE